MSISRTDGPEDEEDERGPEPRRDGRGSSNEGEATPDDHGRPSESILDAKQLQKDPRNQEAFERLERHYRDRIKSLVKSKLGPRTKNLIDPMDIITQAWMKFLNWIHNYDPAKHGSPRCPLWNIIENTIVDEVRRLEGRSTRACQGLGLDGFEELAHEGPSPRTILGDLEAKELDRARLNAAMESLTPTYRDVLYLHYYARMDLIEIAKVMDKKPETIRKMKSRAIDALSKALRGDQGGRIE